MIKLKVLDHPHQTYRMILEKVKYTIKLNYNSREGGWYLSVGDKTETQMLRSVKIVANYPLLFEYRGDFTPPGVFYASSPNEDESLPRDAFQSGAVLMYFTELEASQLLDVADPAFFLISAEEI